MTIPNGCLRLYVTFHDGLRKVEINADAPAATRQIDDPSLPRMGFVYSAEELENLLDAANVDYLQDTPGDAGLGIASTAVARTPNNIIEGLKKVFGSPNPLKDIVVYASSVPAARGLERVRDWFEKRVGGNKTRLAGR